MAQSGAQEAPVFLKEETSQAEEDPNRTPDEDAIKHDQWAVNMMQEHPAANSRIGT